MLDFTFVYWAVVWVGVSYGTGEWMLCWKLKEDMGEGGNGEVEK